jgi:hypothetical protein
VIILVARVKYASAFLTAIPNVIKFVTRKGTRRARYIVFRLHIKDVYVIKNQVIPNFLKSA